MASQVRPQPPLSRSWQLARSSCFGRRSSKIEARPDAADARMDRREFLIGNLGAALLARLRADALAQQQSRPRPSDAWDAGQVRHLLPTVSDRRILVKVSFARALPAAPTLRVGSSAVRGRMSDTAGEC